jgi:hypothetical protein
MVCSLPLIASPDIVHFQVNPASLSSQEKVDCCLPPLLSALRASQTSRQRQQYIETIDLRPSLDKPTHIEKVSQPDQRPCDLSRTMNEPHTPSPRLLMKLRKITILPRRVAYLLTHNVPCYQPPVSIHHSCPRDPCQPYPSSSSAHSHSVARP